MATKEFLDEIREVKKHCTSDKFNYDDGYGEICNLVFTALDIADELTEVSLFSGGKLVYGKDVPDHYKEVIQTQLDRISREIDR